MSLRLGSGYIGSSSIQTSTSNQQIIPTPPSNWTLGYNCYKFSFVPLSSCSVQINNGQPIYIDADSGGFYTDHIDAPIWSFVVIESNIQFYWMAAY
jgi:hypothetical protein